MPTPWRTARRPGSGPAWQKRKIVQILAGEVIAFRRQLSLGKGALENAYRSTADRGLTGGSWTGEI